MSVQHGHLVEPNDPKRAPLHDLAESAGEIAAVCDHDVPEFAMMWHTITWKP